MVNILSLKGTTGPDYWQSQIQRALRNFWGTIAGPPCCPTASRPRHIRRWWNTMPEAQMVSRRNFICMLFSDSTDWRIFFLYNCFINYEHFISISRLQVVLSIPRKLAKITLESWVKELGFSVSLSILCSWHWATQQFITLALILRGQSWWWVTIRAIT